jgi:pimeloyl-ACP methyl ester carboxylesterase
MRVRIVAHSLGARLTMFLLDELRTRPSANLVVEKVVVMAAAVPTSELAPKRPLRLSADSVVRDGLLSLYSPNDRVLQFAFPSGESLAGNGFFPTALGRNQWSGASAIGEPRTTTTRAPEPARAPAAARLTPVRVT